MQFIIDTYGSLLLQAMGQTLLLALLGLAFGCILGIIFGMLSVIHSKVCNVISLIYVNFIRGVPMIVLAFFVYLGLPYGLKLAGITFTLSPLEAGTVCLALNCGAYLSEIIRAGIQSIDKGQYEAGECLGLGKVQVMVSIILPQALKLMIPSLCNQFIISVKDTSLLTVIGVAEMTHQASQAVSSTFRTVEIYTALAIMYFLLNTILSGVLSLLERRMK